MATKVIAQAHEALRLAASIIYRPGGLASQGGRRGRQEGKAGGRKKRERGL